MNLKTLKPTLFKLHRWIGVGLAPLFLLIALSGAVLALKPMQQQTPAAATEAAAVPHLINLLEQLDPLGQEINAVSIDAATNQVNVRSQNPQIQGQFDLASGARISGGEQAESFDLFEIAKHLHKELLLGADILIQVASYLMLLIVITAPLLAWPRLRNNLMGWHRGAGWLLLPVVLMLPLTGVLMSLHVGMPELPRMSQPGASLSLTQALQMAQQDQDLKGLNMARRFRGGSVLLSITGAQGKRSLFVTDQAVTPVNPQGNLVKTLHEGNWAGAWSGALNLMGAMALSLLSLTGFISWRRRQLKRRKRQLKLKDRFALADES